MTEPTINHFCTALDNLTAGKNLSWRIVGEDTYANTTFFGGDGPTEAEVAAEYKKLVDAYAAVEYQRKRAAEYPAIGDQLDMIYKAGQGGDAFQAAIKAVKDKYPKPE